MWLYETIKEFMKLGIKKDKKTWIIIQTHIRNTDIFRHRFGKA